MTTENNKIIDKFLNRTVSANQYHENWNELMEVVQKILTVGDNTDQWDNVLNELQTVNIRNVYNACIEFIKWYNEQTANKN